MVNYNLNIKNVPVTALTQDSTTMPAAFTSLGSFSVPTVIDFVNASSKVVEVSLDGTNIHDAVPAGIYKPYVGTDHHASKSRVWIPAGVSIYIRGSAGTGTFYVTAAGV